MSGPIVRLSDMVPHRQPPPGYDYACTGCGKGLTEDEADRHLIADWPHCDECWRDMAAQLDREEEDDEG